MRSRPGAQHQSAECSIASCVVLVGGVVGSGTCCAGFLLDTLHLARSCLAFETGSVRKKKMLSV